MPARGGLNVVSRRRTRWLALLVVAASVMPLAACGAGQVAATAENLPAVEGAGARRGGLTLADIRIATPLTGAYRIGDDAELYGAISADDMTSDTLVSIRTAAAPDVTLKFGLGIGAPAASDAAPSGSTSAASTASASASASTGPSPSTGPGPGEINLPISSGKLPVFKSGGDILLLHGLTRVLTPGMTVSMTFSFAQAGDITLDVPVATPDSPGPRPTPSKAPAE